MSIIAKTIADLMNQLVLCGVIPYYIFQCRPVEGIQNQFQVPILDGIELIDEAKKAMNGQSKSVRYVMSHPSGKIELVGKNNGQDVIFKYHQAKYEKEQSRIFHMDIGQKQ